MCVRDGVAACRAAVLCGGMAPKQSVIRSAAIPWVVFPNPVLIWPTNESEHQDSRETHVGRDTELLQTSDITLAKMDLEFPPRPWELVTPCQGSCPSPRWLSGDPVWPKLPFGHTPVWPKFSVNAPPGSCSGIGGNLLGGPVRPKLSPPELSRVRV